MATSEWYGCIGMVWLHQNGMATSELYGCIRMVWLHQYAHKTGGRLGALPTPPLRRFLGRHRPHSLVQARLPRDQPRGSKHLQFCWPARPSTHPTCAARCHTPCPGGGCRHRNGSAVFGGNRGIQNTRQMMHEQGKKREGAKNEGMGKRKKHSVTSWQSFSRPPRWRIWISRLEERRLEDCTSDCSPLPGFGHWLQGLSYRALNLDFSSFCFIRRRAQRSSTTSHYIPHQTHCTL